MYAPNSSVAFSPSNGVDFWGLGLQITGVASLTGAINLIVTVINMRAPGMSLMKLPIFTWMVLVVQFLLLFAIPVITVALFMLMFQRSFDATFFSVEAGADPLLWQHLFWIFGHPEVYILVLPSFGIVSEILPVFSKKPLFGYPLVVFSGAAIGFVGWASGLTTCLPLVSAPISVAAFSVATMAIHSDRCEDRQLDPHYVGRKKLRFTVPMLYSVGVIVQFTIGGLSGVTHSVAPSDTQQTDTYYIVAHFHYVIFGGAVLGLFAGMYYWWPKMFGKMLNERLGRVNFWLTIIGMNLTFGPMHIVGLQGQPRRMYVWTENRAGDGFFNIGFWNLIASIGSFVLALGILLFFVNIYVSHRKGTEKAPLDPWMPAASNGSRRTRRKNTTSIACLRWVTSMSSSTGSTKTVVQMAITNSIRSLQLKRLSLKKRTTLTGTFICRHRRTGPILLAFSLPIMAYGVIYNVFLVIGGAVLGLVSFYGWGLEPHTAPEDDYDPPTGTAMEVAAHG